MKHIHFRILSNLNGYLAILQNKCLDFIRSLQVRTHFREFERYVVANAAIVFALQEGIGAGINNALYAVFFLSVLCLIMDWWKTNGAFTWNKSIRIDGRLLVVILFYAFLLFSSVQAKTSIDEEGYLPKKVVLENLRNNYFYLAAQEEFGAWNNAEIKGSRCGAICSEYKAKSNAINRRLHCLMLQRRKLNKCGRRRG